MAQEGEVAFGAEAHYARKKVVIVDDSRTIRGWLRVILDADPRLTVVGEADTALAARDVIKRTNPDVLTLDIEMPGMNGLAFLEKLIELRPMPVVMISGATEANSNATITALSLGAVDCILKPTALADQSVHRDITRRVFSAACSSVQVTRRPIRREPQARTTHEGPLPIILIGASTGGVAALESVLADLAPDGPPVVIVQHMPGTFLVSFAQMLNRQLAQDVAIARADEVLHRGQVRLAPALGQHAEVVRRGTDWSCRFVAEPANALHCPSVDTLFHSAVPHASRVMAVILTGLGQDGALGLKALREAGAWTIGQDAATSVVYGMPRVAFELGGVARQAPLHQIGTEVNRAIAARRRHKMQAGAR